MLDSFRSPTVVSSSGGPQTLGISLPTTITPNGSIIKNDMSRASRVIRSLVLRVRPVIWLAKHTLAIRSPPTFVSSGQPARGTTGAKSA